MSDLLLRAKGTCVCTKTFQRDAVLTEAEFAISTVILGYTRETLLLSVAKAVLEHSSSHESVSMILTLKMEETP